MKRLRSLLLIGTALTVVGCASTKTGLGTAANDVSNTTKAVVQVGPAVLNQVGVIGATVVQLLNDAAGLFGLFTNINL